MRVERGAAAAGAAVVAMLVVVGYWYLRAPESTQVKAGMTAPNLELPSVGSGGIKTKLSNFRGRPVLLVMYMSGCRICEREIDSLERLHREFLQRGLVVLGVAVDAEAAAREEFIRRHQLTFIVLEDPNGRAVREAYGSWKMPEAYLIDREGKVDAVYLGSVDWQAPELRERVERLLPPEPPRKLL
jgi:peroxiredoxin